MCVWIWVWIRTDVSVDCMSKRYLLEDEVAGMETVEISPLLLLSGSSYVTL